MDRSGPHWSINSSFSPPLPRRWDCRLQPNESTHVTNATSIYGSSASSSTNHHHSVSDGAVSYYGSSSDNLQAPRWTPPVQSYDLGEFSTPAGGARPEASIFFQSNEQQRITSRVPSMSSSLGSPFTHSESSQWASSSKPPILFPPRNFSGRCSFMSKPVYPLVYRNPISDAKIYGTPATPGSTTFSPDLKFRTNIVEVSPDPNTSSFRREGFRWSNASSSYDFGSDVDTIDNMESPYNNNSKNSARFQKCVLCERPLWQKSPWSSRRIVRSNDMPVSAVLPCCHVFHVDCLEETTPITQVHEPPCPVCQKEISASEGSVSFSEAQQVGANVNAVSDGGAGSSSSLNPDWNEGSDVRRNLSLPMPWRGGSLLKSHFKKRFSLKGKTGKDLFGAKMFWRSASSSSSSLLHNDSSQSRVGRLKFQQFLK